MLLRAQGIAKPAVIADGEQYIGIEPGGDTNNLAQGSTVTLTQSAVVLEQLIGKYLFGGDEDKSKP